MFNSSSLKTPLISFPTHEVSGTAIFFIPEKDFSLKNEITFSQTTPFLQEGSELLVYEYGLGIGAKWARVKTNENTIGYVNFNNLKPKNNYPPFYSVNKNPIYQSDAIATEINWKTQKPNVPYYDAKNAVHVVHCELQDITKIENSAQLAQYMEEARKIGTENILKQNGFKYDEYSLNQLLNNYYLFSTSEDWYIDPRPCSTLRVAVTIPARFLNAQTDLLTSEIGQVEKITIPIETTTAKNEDNNFILSFSNYQQYKDFFDKLIKTLEKYHLIYNTKLWVIDPLEVNVDFLFEANNVRSLVEETNNLIIRNQPQFAKTKITNILMKPEVVWDNSLDIIIDKQKIEIKELKYYSENKTYSLKAGLISYQNSDAVNNKTTVNYCLTFNPNTDYIDPVASIAKGITQVVNPAGAIAAGGLTAINDTLKNLVGGSDDEEIKNFLINKHYPSVNNAFPKPLDLYNCTIDTVKRIEDLKSYKLPLEIQKWKRINAAYESKQIVFEGDLFLRSLRSPKEYVQDPNMRILLGIDTMPGKTEEEKLATYLTVAQTIDWSKFLGVAAQCMAQSISPEELMQLMQKYKEARKFIEQIFMSTLCNPYLKNGIKLINGFQLPVFNAYNPNQALALELESVYAKIMNDLLSMGIKKALEAAAKACASNPKQNFNNGGALNNPLDPDANVNDPAIDDLLNDLSAYNQNQSPTSSQNKDQIKQQYKNIIEDITACLSLKELCSLYNGISVNDEVYQVVISLVKRKYGSPYAEAFATRQQIIRFFKTLGKNVDLSVCPIEQGPEAAPNNGSNILCDDGRVKELRAGLLADHGLSRDLIDQALQAIKADETKALEDVLKILNSDNPFDFSQAPDLGCKVMPNGASLAPSMESFTSMVNSMLRTTYDTFDREGRDWYKTTYSIINKDKPSFLTFNSSSGDIEVKQDINSTITPNLSKTVQENSGSSVNEIKLPSFMFKTALSNPEYAKAKYIKNGNISYVEYSSSLNGDIQQKLDIDFIEKDFKLQIQKGENLLSNFSQQVWAQILLKFETEVFKLAFNQTPRPIISLIYALDSILKNNTADVEHLNSKLKDAYKALGVSSVQEANGFFAAENGAAIYLVVCEELSKDSVREQFKKLIDFSTNVTNNNGLITNKNYETFKSINELLDETIKQYGIVKDYYKTIVQLKINYPDFDTVYQSGINILDQAAGSYSNGYLYDIQKIEVQKNKKNFIKVTERNKVSSNIQGYMQNDLSLDKSKNYNKEIIFHEYLKNKINKYGPTSGLLNNQVVDADIAMYADINERIYNKISSNILSKNNKFIYLKDISSTYVVSTAETGSGQPYTQYLKLVVDQTPVQKICGIRPHYLDIDSVKQQAIDDKSKNTCVEKIVDDRVVGNKPINNSDLGDIETTSTQNTMLRATYTLATRIFLHDIVLRSIAIFGYYDPQSLRDEPAFISFVAKKAESEMRGMDNNFFLLLSSFLKKDSNKTFRDLVSEEIKNFVLPKLAKRINVDTNLALVNNTPKDNPINLINIYDDVPNMDIIYYRNNSVYIKIKNPYTNFAAIAGTNLLAQQFIEQKIFDGSLQDFLITPEFDFLFKYLFPVSQTLNNFFILNCLATSTRKQVVNSFKGTKKDIIATCKILQSNGQVVAGDPNDAQSTSIDPIELIIGFLVQAVIKTPINILKGVAESSEPNIMLSSTALKAVRAVSPNISSLMIPAISLPLGLIPAPVLPLLPFVNPTLSIAYFASLAWYDDKPVEQGVSSTAKHLEENILKDLVCKDTINQDNFYLDKTTPIGSGLYDIKKDQGNYNSTKELTPEEVTKLMLDKQTAKVINKIADELKLNPYQYPDPNNNNNLITEPIKHFIDDSKLQEIAKNAIKNIEQTIIKANFNSVLGDAKKFQNAYDEAIKEANKLSKQYIESIFDPLTKSAQTNPPSGPMAINNKNSETQRQDKNDTQDRGSRNSNRRGRNTD